MRPSLEYAGPMLGMNSKVGGIGGVWLGLATGLLLLGGCGLFDFDSDSDSNSGDGGSNNSRGSWTLTETYGGLTDGQDGGWWSDSWYTEGGYTEPPTTGIEMTGADNMLPDDEIMCPCVDDNDDIYVLSDAGAIWSFDPETYEFTFITEVKCGGMYDTFSMGVSRKGRAWIEYFTGDIFTLDLKDPGSECKDPGFKNDDPLFPTFGMAFVANSLTDPCDKLYVHSGIAPEVVGDDVGALGYIDPQTIELVNVAPIDYGWGELTGTGDGRLFAFEGSAPPILSEYDKDTGLVLDSWPLPGLVSANAFAFAYWGGYFYFFTEDELSTGYSKVTEYDFYDIKGEGTILRTVVEQAPMRIVGAGVSTCAPPDPQ